MNTLTPSDAAAPPSTLRRLTAFSRSPDGGNPAGVWTGPALPSAAEMQRIAAQVGYSETAFATPLGDGRYRVRYYSPEAEVSFCGHATIATGVVLGERHGEGTYVLETAVGDVPVEVTRSDEGLVASLTSVETRQDEPTHALLDATLRTLGWTRDLLDPRIPPMRAFAGAWHLVLAVREKGTLDALDYDFADLKRTMLDDGLTTLQLIWRESDTVFHARDPFPVGGVVEDPATGAAAAALGGYLRDAGLLPAPATFLIHQGVAMGRASRLEVSVPAKGGITVTGAATALDRATPLRALPARPADLIQQFLSRVWSSPADLDAIDELMTEDYAITSAGTVVRGRDAFREWVAEFQSVLLHATTEPVDVFEDAGGERVVARWICRGRNNGIFGLEADGRPIEFTGIAIWRIRDGRLAECWVERSALEVVRGS